MKPGLPCALLLLAACTPAASRPPPRPVAAVDASDAARAAELAPDLHARSRRAEAEARGAERPEAARDHEARAQLLLAAAVAEADRIELDRERAALEARHAEVGRQHAALERERIELVQAIQLHEAAAIARAEATRVFEQAEEQESRRRDRGQREQARAEAVRFHLQRAELTLAAAATMGAPEPLTRAARQAIDAVSRAGGGGARLAAAQQALATAQRALGAARRAGAGPDGRQVASLLEAGRQRGLSIESLPRGVAVSLEGFFRGTGAQLTATGRRRVEHLRALLRAHPHGPVQLELLAPAGTRGAAVQRGRARLRTLTRELSAVAGERLNAAATVGGLSMLVLPAYALDSSR